MLYVAIGALVSGCRKLASEQKSALDSASSTLEVDCAEEDLMISLEEYPELQMINGSAHISFPDQFVHLLVVKIAEEYWTAVWKICTHGNCEVEWRSSLGVVQCPCHDSWFDIDGRVLQGPATRDLSVYSVCRKENLLYLKKTG